MGFVKDLARSREAVEAILDHLVDNGHVAYELEGKEEQKLGDIAIEQVEGQVNIEIKYDMYAARSNNLCFELSNGKKETGIAATKADLVYYVVPQKEGRKRIFVFEPNKLRDFLSTSSKVVAKKGGDKRKFHLALVSIQDVEEEGLAQEDFII